MSEIDCQGLHSKAAAHTAVPLVPSPVLPYLLRGHMLPWRKPWQMQIFFRKNSRKHQPPWTGKKAQCAPVKPGTHGTQRGKDWANPTQLRITPVSPHSDTLKASSPGQASPPPQSQRQGKRTATQSPLLCPPSPGQSDPKQRAAPSKCLPEPPPPPATRGISKIWMSKWESFIPFSTDIHTAWMLVVGLISKRYAQLLSSNTVVSLCATIKCNHVSDCSLPSYTNIHPLLQS